MYKQISKSDLVWIYDFGLKNRIKNEGINYLCTAVSNDQKRFWLFGRSPEVEQVIREYTGR